jgi:hypothetical protein
MDKSLHNFHRSSFYNSKQTADEEGVVDVPKVQCVSVVNKEEFDHAVMHLLDWTHSYLASTHKHALTVPYRDTHTHRRTRLPQLGHARVHHHP